MTSRQSTNWQTIRILYEQGELSNRELARQYAPLTEGAIRKRAKQEIWARPERERIVRRTASIPRTRRQNLRPWLGWEAAARSIVLDHRDRVHPVGSSLEEMLEVAGSALAMLLQEHINKVRNRESIIDDLKRSGRTPHSLPRIS